jgi:DNA-binding protein H-NS
MSRTPHNAALADVLPLIESLELPYLESLQQLLAEHIAKRREEAISEARAKIMKIALSIGMSPEAVLELGAPARKTPANAGQPKYRDPESGKTWSGLGKVPLWIRDKDRSQFLIEGRA